MDEPNPGPGTAGGPVEFIPQERWLLARHRGTYSHEAYKRFIVGSIEACAGHGVTLLLVDLTSLAEFHPNTAQRFEMGALAARVAKEVRRIAILGTPEQIEEEFGSLVARNRGLNVQAFTDRDLALGWLLGPEEPSPD